MSLSHVECQRSQSSHTLTDVYDFTQRLKFCNYILKGHCIEFKYYADGIHSGLTPPGNNS